MNKGDLVSLWESDISLQMAHPGEVTVGGLFEGGLLMQEGFQVPDGTLAIVTGKPDTNGRKMVVMVPDGRIGWVLVLDCKPPGLQR